MPEYLAPGVYVEEIDLGPKPIEGVGTSTAGFLGMTERGPVSPQFVTNITQFQQIHGGGGDNSFLADAVDGFFRNGGRRCFVGRIVPGHNKNGSVATASATVGNAFTINAIGPGSWGNNVYYAVDNASNLRPERFKLSLYYWKSPLPASATWIAPAARLNPWSVAFEKPADSGSPADGTGNESDVSAPEGRTPPANPAAGETSPPNVVDPSDQNNRRNPQRREPSVFEVFDNLSVDPTSPDYYERKVNGVSRLVELSPAQNTSNQRPKNSGIADLTSIAGDKPSTSSSQLYADGVAIANGRILTTTLTGAPDESTASSPSLADYQGITTAGQRTGLAAFADIDEIAIVAIPDESQVTGLTEELIGHCELLRDRFAVISVPPAKPDVSNLRPPEDSKYAAVYYPWIKVVDPIAGTTKPIPPTGHVVGIYARSDNERGVHKAPANEVVQGAVDLEFPVSKEMQDILNPRGINAIRSFVGRGIRVWGARTTSSDPAWKYVNVRRLFIFLEESIDQGTQWAVFEPNDRSLWERLRGAVSAFLTTQWRNGALQGDTAAQAFFVRVGLDETMTFDDIDNGRVIIVVGVAPVKPAEFVIFRITQMQQGSAIAE